MSRAIPTGRRLPNMQPGSEEWLKYVTGSKIAAIIGISPWESPFSLWHKMAGNIEPEEQTPVQERGVYLEPVVCQWWQDNHPGYRIRRTGSFVHRHRPWQAATPDRIATGPDVIILEAKTDAGSDDRWGVPETDDLPLYYKAQIIWTLDVLGLPRAHVPMLSSRLQFRNYVVEYDAEDAEFMRNAALEFRASLEAGTPPDVDSHSATYQVIKHLHPDINEGVKVKLSPELADRYRAALLGYKAAETEKAAVTALVADALGNGQFATDPDGNHLAQRVNGRAGSPPVMKSLSVKSLEQEIAA